MGNNLITKTNQLFGEVRFIKLEGKEYAIGSDIAKVLGFKNTNDALSRHCKGVVKTDTLTNGGMQSISVIPESDIYRLIIKSKLPKAEEFERWVMEEILPELRRTGIVIMENATDKDISNADKFRIRKVKQTFAELKPREIEGVYEDFIEFVSFKPPTERIKLYNSAIKGLEDFKLACKDFIYPMVAESKIRTITELKAVSGNRKNGGIKSGQTKTINKLINENNKLKKGLESYIGRK